MKSMSLWCRAVVALGGVLGGVALGAQPAAADVDWFQLPPGCAVKQPEVGTTNGQEPRIVACGGAGSFVIGGAGLHYDGQCRLLDHGSETPSPIPDEPEPRLTPAFPCPGGKCLGHTPGSPWVAVVDWPGAHGWSVAAMVREASDQRVGVELYDLTAGGGLAQWVPSLSDLHVLVQLCAVAETVRANPLDRPLAVNMSFGRRTAGTECPETGSGLACSVAGVLSHLAGEGVLPVAAAGNHHELLFPASSPGVVSAGAVDLSHLEQTRESRPSTQTPPASAALMLGYGIYLSADEGAAWPAPPGSSYAAAMLTGWLGGYLAGGGSLPSPLLLPGARWTPAIAGDTATGLALALNGVPLRGSELRGPQLLFERALGANPTSRELETVITLPLAGPAPPLPKRSLLYADAGNGPQPGVDPCVPCRGNGLQGGAAEGADTVLIDLSSSGRLPSPIHLTAVFLRVGKAVYAFDDRGDDSLLAAIAGGTLEGLALTGVGGIFQPGDQPSLVLVVNVDGTAYWHEVPLNMPR
jgi:hypothetical protein